jgi:hypothetical protein
VMHVDIMFKNCRWARMSDGHYCLVRDLGLVKGGKGLRYHEVVVDLSLRGMKVLAKQGATSLATKVATKLEQRIGESKWSALLRIGVREPQ